MNTWFSTCARRPGHYSLLAGIEELFGLPRLGYAATPGLDRFGLDVYNARV
jgi:phosphatidylinositol-3-phosphatase